MKRLIGSIALMFFGLLGLMGVVISSAIGKTVPGEKIIYSIANNGFQVIYLLFAIISIIGVILVVLESGIIKPKEKSI